MRVQSPIRLGESSEPQPDLVLLRRREDFYRAAHPQPADILLVIEIAATSQDHDRDVKAPLYARHAIVEYWLVDLESGTLTRHTLPDGGTYRSVLVHAQGDAIAPRMLPDCAVVVDELI
jgi:Uma2 family endonuclease